MRSQWTKGQTTTITDQPSVEQYEPCRSQTQIEEADPESNHEEGQYQRRARQDATGNEEVIAS